MSYAASAPPTEKRGLSSSTPKHGLTNGTGMAGGTGRTNGGRTNGGRTNGSGRTNGQGRTNGNGFTNGSGKTNGGSFSGRELRSLSAAAKRRTRRKALAGAAVALIVAMSVAGALGLAGGASQGPRVDGQFEEWNGRVVPVAPSSRNTVGLAGFAFMASPSGPMGYFEFAQPISERTDLWVFIDTDGDSATGFFDGALGADSAALVRLSGGRALSGTQLSFAGGDTFDLNRLAPTGAAPAFMAGPRLEVQLPAVGRSFSVSAGGLSGATTSGALDANGAAVQGLPRTAPTTNEVRNGIRIDGVFSDWATVLRSSEPTQLALPGRLDLTSAAAIGDDASAQFYLQTREGVLQGTLPLRAEPLASSTQAAAASAPLPPRRIAGTDLLQVYLDRDLDASTGAPVGGIGADLVLRVEGIAGRVVSAQAFLFGAGGQWVEQAGAAQAASAGRELEASLAGANLVGARAKFTLAGFEGAGDENAAPVSVGRAAGAIGPAGTTSGPQPTSRTDIPLNPIPEISDVAAVAAGVLVLTLGGRFRRRQHATGAPQGEDPVG